MQHRGDGDGNDFRIGNFRAGVFAVSACFEKIVNKTAYCDSAIAHLLVLFGELVWRQNSKRGLFLHQIANSMTGNLG
jgi:hypothetical protein